MPEELSGSEKMSKAEYVRLAEVLSENTEGFPFPALKQEAHERMKADQESGEDRSTPIDELIERCRTQGIKVVVGKNRKNENTGDVYILPRDSDDIKNDILFPRHLVIDDSMDPKLRELIRANERAVG